MPSSLAQLQKKKRERSGELSFGERRARIKTRAGGRTLFLAVRIKALAIHQLLASVLEASRSGVLVQLGCRLNSGSRGTRRFEPRVLERLRTAQPLRGVWRQELRDQVSCVARDLIKLCGRELILACVLRISKHGPNNNSTHVWEWLKLPRSVPETILEYNLMRLLSRNGGSPASRMYKMTPTLQTSAFWL